MDIARKILSDTGLRYKAARLSNTYITSDDLLQEAALMAWQVAQQRPSSSWPYLIGVAKNAMSRAARMGRSVDKPWLSYNRQPDAIPTILSINTFIDENGEMTEGESPCQDERASQFPAVVMLREMLRQIYSYEGYNPTEKAILEALRTGFNHKEIRASLNLSRVHYKGIMVSLRTKILLNVFGGKDIKLHDMQPARLQLSAGQKAVFRLLSKNKTQPQVARQLGVTRVTILCTVRQIRCKQVLVDMGLPPTSIKDGKAANRAWI